MSEHTPGPWRVVEAHNNTQVSAGAGDNLKGIADIFDDRDGVPEYDANARLIAAAPDMLAALEAMVDSEHWMELMSCTRLRDAKAAIAKAKGVSEKPVLPPWMGVEE